MEMTGHSHWLTRGRALQAERIVDTQALTVQGTERKRVWLKYSEQRQNMRTEGETGAVSPRAGKVN